MKILLATANAGKAREVRELLAGTAFEVLSLKDLPQPLDIEENGQSFVENAVIKARAAAEASGLLSLGEDSGLEVAALNGAPGIYSARYAKMLGRLPAGKLTAEEIDRANIESLLYKLADVPLDKRQARFCSALALIDPRSGRQEVVTGFWEGSITREPRGTAGFGYDPIFLVPQLNRTVSELTPQEKNTLSHRAQALAKLKQVLLSFL